MKMYAPVVLRMSKGDFAGVQQEARCPFSGYAGIEFITQDRVTQCRQMHAQLV